MDFIPEIIKNNPIVSIIIIISVFFVVYCLYSKKHKNSIPKRAQDYPSLPENQIPKAKEDLEIQILDQFLSPEECDFLIQQATPRFKRSQVMHKNENSKQSTDQGRTSHSASFQKDEFPLLTEVDKRVSQILGIPPNHIEGLQMVKYTSGQQYRPHHDWFKPPHDDTKNERIYTILVYLNDDYQGGETYFPKVKYGFKGKKGDAILWRNCAENSPDKCFDHSLHAGTPPTSGTKYALNVWIRFNPYYKSKHQQAKNT